VFRSPFDRERFVQSKWKAAAADLGEKNARGPMAEDLRRRVLRKGMSNAAVRALLGKPDNSEAEEKAGEEDSYSLGHWGSVSIEGDRLIIHYDRSKRIASTEIYEH
jgi:hypothetical protein